MCSWLWLSSQWDLVDPLPNLVELIIVELIIVELSCFMWRTMSKFLFQSCCKSIVQMIIQKNIDVCRQLCEARFARFLLLVPQWLVALLSLTGTSIGLFAIVVNFTKLEMYFYLCSHIGSGMSTPVTCYWYLTGRHRCFLLLAPQWLVICYWYLTDRYRCYLLLVAQ